MKHLLIVVDYQVDFVTGALGFPGAERLDGPIAEKIAQYRAQGDELLFTMDTHDADYMDTKEGVWLPVPHCIKGSDGWQLYGAVGAARMQGDPVFEKETFPSLELGEWLREKPYASVTLCGLVSHICVLSNAIMAKAALPNAEIIVDAALTASADAARHEKALDVLEGVHIAVRNRGG